jgi:hypothetical protein
LPSLLTDLRKIALRVLPGYHCRQFSSVLEVFLAALNLPPTFFDLRNHSALPNHSISGTGKHFQSDPWQPVREMRTMNKEQELSQTHPGRIELKPEPCYTSINICACEYYRVENQISQRFFKKGFGNKSNNEGTTASQRKESLAEGLNEFFRGKIACTSHVSATSGKRESNKLAG